MTNDLIKTANDSNLQFIREKIYQLRSAIMYSMSNELVKIPNSIVTAVKVDEEGQLWFVSKSHLQNLAQCEQSFPVRLHFFRKGTNFFVVVSGKAFIVNNADAQLNSHGTLGDDQEKSILIKMSMNDIEYTEPEARREKNKLEIFLENSFNWLLHTIAFHRHSKSVFQKLQQN
jgi:general stress protein 26